MAIIDEKLRCSAVREAGGEDIVKPVIVDVANSNVVRVGTRVVCDGRLE